MRGWAQEIGDQWTAPVNLSNSGNTASPSVVIDSEGVIHVIWNDAYDGTVYTAYTNDVWGLPQAINFPFSNPVSAPGQAPIDTVNFKPTLFSNDQGSIYAFWLNELNQLYYSYVQAANFGDPNSWAVAIQISEAAVDFDVFFDEVGNLHLAYVRNIETSEFPAGIYIRSSVDRGLSWNTATVIYQSSYFRSLTPGTANVDLDEQSGSGGATLYLAWDNRSRKQVFFSRSIDNGLSWSDPVIIDGPTQVDAGSSPLNIRITGNINGPLLTWQNGDPAVSCEQYYQSSQDNGVNWGTRAQMLDNFVTCPQEQYFFKQGEMLILMAKIQDQIYLMAWDGLQWSEPQAQPTLYSFQDPITFDLVALSGQTPAIDLIGNLFVVGSDSGLGGDTWVTSRSVGDISLWFPPPTSWKPGEIISQSETEIMNLSLLSDNGGSFHALWMDKIQTSSGDLQDFIYYTRKSNDQWINPVAILRSPIGFTRQPAAALDPEGNLFVVWSGGEMGEIYFSRAVGNRAEIPAEWSVPAILPMLRPVGSSPDILVMQDGVIAVVYAIPINEQRGIYLTTSNDGGGTWTEPLLAFDAVQSGWEIVDQPQIARTADGVIHVVMKQYSVLGGSDSIGLFYTGSSDGGQAWSEIHTLSNQPILWSDVVAAGARSVHILWLEMIDNRPVLYHQISSDSGASWSMQPGISLSGEMISFPSLIVDSSDRVHLILIDDSSNTDELLHWIWGGDRWIAEESSNNIVSEDQTISYLAAAASNEGLLTAIYSFISEIVTNEQAPFSLAHTSRTIEIPAVTPDLQVTTVLPEPTSTPTPVFAITQTHTPTATPTQSSDLNIQAETAGSSWGGLVIGIIGGVVLVTLGFLIRLAYLKTR